MVDDLLRSLPNKVQGTVDPAVLAPFATDESGRRGKVPLALARPKTTADVQALIGWAKQRKLTLVPVSSPKGPRRRGDTVSDQASVIVDLSGMDRIINIDGRDAAAIIEPGVTFPVFNLALGAHGLRSFQPLAPRASKSVLAAFLEREPTTVPAKHWDAADPLASLELVFGTGDLFRTGNADTTGTLEENLARGNRYLNALGPTYTDFGRVVHGSQGALGIATWGSIICQRIPAVELPFFASSDEPGPVIELCYQMLRRRPAGQMFILNNVQLALLLAEDALSYEALKAALPRFILYIEITATSYFPEEAIAYQRADLERDAATFGVKLSSELAGQPATSVPQRQRAFSDIAAHQRAGRICQEVFCLSQLDAAPKQIEAISAIVPGDGDVAVYLQPLAQGVNVHCQYTLLDQPARQATLSRLAVAAADALAENRGFFSRPYHPWAHVPFQRDPHSRSLVSITKSLFDPDHVLQPASLIMGGAQ